MHRGHFSVFDDSFFNAPGDFESSFKNLETFMNRPMQNLALRGNESNDRELTLRNDSFGHVFDDIDKHFMGMNDIFNKHLASFDFNFNQQNDPNGAFYSSSSVYTYQNDPKSNEPRIYQAHKSIKQGPGGIREEQKAERDSRRAEEKMAIGRYIGDRGREIERKRNIKTGNNEENTRYHGLDECEGDRFNDEWNRLAHKSFNSGPRMENSRQISDDYHGNNNKSLKNRNAKSDNQHLAITGGKSRVRKRH